MGIQSIEDGKKLRKYCSLLGREGVAKRIIEIAEDIVKQEGAYQTTLINAGKIRALAMGAQEDCYWGEKQGLGFQSMVDEAERATPNQKTL